MASIQEASNIFQWECIFRKVLYTEVYQKGKRAVLKVAHRSF